MSRVQLSQLKPADIEISTKGKNIRDPLLQKALASVTAGKDGKDFEKALVEFSHLEGPYCGIRRVRLIEALHKTKRVEIYSRKDGEATKAYKADSNHCYELWQLPSGKLAPQVVTTYEANTGDVRQPHPAAKRLLKVFKRDMVAVEGQTQLFIVQQLSIDNGLILVPHNEANADARHRDKSDKFKFKIMGHKRIFESKLRRVFVDEIGRTRDKHFH